MRHPKRYSSDQAICDAIDRLKDEIPILYEQARRAAQEAEKYLGEIEEHLTGFRTRKQPDEHEPWEVYKQLMRASKIAARKPRRWELKIKKLSEALAVFRTERMPFLPDNEVEVR